MDTLVPYSDLKEMAAQVVKGGLFPGIKTPEQALTLFLLAQAEGLHPMTATMRYNIIQNRPAMKAEAMLASFMDRGGTVDWTEYTDEAVTGIFRSHGVPKGVTVRWTMADAKRAGVTMNQTWTKYPRQMLKARVASDGVRMTDPAVNQGRYTPEEVSEFDGPVRKVVEAEIIAPEPPQAVTVHILEEGEEPPKGEKALKAVPWDELIKKHPPKTEALEEDLTPALEASLAKLKAEGSGSLFGGDGRLPEPDDAEPEYCPECQGEVHTYKSRKGPDVRSCSFGRALWLETHEKTKNKEHANRAAAGHFYELQT